MRADRLVSLVLLLRQRGRMSAPALAAELDVSTRTVLRDIEALSTAGVPVYAERGRHGGFALLPGFRTELTGLNPDEALALLTAGAGRGEQVFGLGSALASATRKVVDALPEGSRVTASDATQRFLVEPEADLLARRQEADDVPAPVMTEVRRAVLAGHKLRIHYATADREPTWRTVDPLGLVTVRGKGYLLATVSGADRTFRLSRIREAQALAEPAERPDQVDLDRMWAQRSHRFRTGGDQVVVRLRMNAVRRPELVGTALAVLAETAEAAETAEPAGTTEPVSTTTEPAGTAGWLRLDVAFQDLRHAVWALWQLDTDAEALEPESLRDALRDRAVRLATRYAQHTGPRPGAQAADAAGTG